MKIIINTSNLYTGGGLQVALSFINELIDLKLINEYHIFISTAVSKQLDKKIFPNNFYFYLVEASPSSLKTRLQVISQLNKLEEEIQANVVFTVFGPSYWKPKALHLIGFADGWLYNPDSVAYDKVSFIKKIKMKLLNIYKSYYLKRDGDFFVLETGDAQKKFTKTLRLRKEKVFVVGNTYSSNFNNLEYQNENNKFYIKLPEKKVDEVRLMYIAHNHPSKNLNVINELYSCLNKKNIKFVLTVDDASYKNMFNDKKYILNLGPIQQKSCASVYKQCDMLFAPTLLETFSAAYPEAMKMKVPILTSNYSFATSICKDAALYFDPLNPVDIANKIDMLINDIWLQKVLVDLGEKRLQEFETASSRALKYIKLCENIVSKEIK